MSDNYMKALFTIIAASLCVIAFQLSFGSAVAQDRGPQRNCGWYINEPCFVATHPGDNFGGTRVLVFAKQN
jgi:hypothetical protein